MAKKSLKLPVIYLVGMALVVVGFICPMFKILGSKPNGFDFVSFENSGFQTIGALLVFCGALAGIVFSVIKIKNAETLKLVALIVTIAGGVVLFLGFNDNVIYREIGKGILKNAYIGFYMVIAGWILGIVGFVMKK